LVTVSFSFQEVNLLTKKNSGGLNSDSNNPDDSAIDGDSADNLWVKHNLALVEPNATTWFEELGPVSAQDLFSSEIERQREIHSHSAYFSGRIEASILPNMQVDLEDLGEPQKLDQTKIGRAVLAELDSRGVEYSFVNTTPLSHFESIQIDLEDELVGQWATEEGTPFPQYFKVYKNKAGEETGLWFVHLLASSVPLPSANRCEIEIDGQSQISSVAIEDLDEGMLSYGEISSLVHLPIFLKNLAFMAETPFPSNQLMSMSRNLAFSEIPVDSRPIPTYSILNDSLVFSISPESEASGSARSYMGQIVPDLVVFGWRFKADSLEHLTDFLATVVDGCNYAVSTVEDGFNNFRTEDCSFDYDSVLANPCIHSVDYVRGNSRVGWPQWIPVTVMGEITDTCAEKILDAQNLNEAGEHQESFEQYFSIANDGVGWHLASAINTLAYSWWIPQLTDNPSGLGVLEFYLEQAVSLNVLDDSTNALTNLGLARLIAGDLEKAKQALEHALEREDNHGNAEAKLYLSFLYRKQGNSKMEEKYMEKSKAAGGFEPPNWIIQALEPESQALTQSNPVFDNSKKSKARFCGECGTKFETESVNFCISCGTKRD